MTPFIPVQSYHNISGVEAYPDYLSMSAINNLPSMPHIADESKREFYPPSDSFATYGDYGLVPTIDISTTLSYDSPGAHVG